MSTITDVATGRVRRSRNLRGLYDHARRVAARVPVPLFCSVRAVDFGPVRGSDRVSAFVRITYADGSVGESSFADYKICRDWAIAFANKRGGKLSLVETIEPVGTPAS